MTMTPVHVIVSDTLNNLFVRMIDERKCLVHFSYKNYLLQCFSTFNCCFLPYLVSIKSFF